MNFRIRGLDARQFDDLFAAVRRIADGPRPCRISLTDSKPGDELILVNYEHHAVASPYRMRFAIYIRRGEETFDAVGEVPEQLHKRTFAVRGFDASGMMNGWRSSRALTSKRRSAANLPTRKPNTCTSISPPRDATQHASTEQRKEHGARQQHGHRRRSTAACDCWPRVAKAQSGFRSAWRQVDALMRGLTNELLRKSRPCACETISLALPTFFAHPDEPK